MKQRFAVVSAAIIATLASVGLAHGQSAVPSGLHTPAVLRQVAPAQPTGKAIVSVSVPRNAPVTAPIKAEMAATKVSTSNCVDSSRTKTTLGLMERSAIHSHCDFP